MNDNSQTADEEFNQLITKVKAGDQAAAFELVRQYEPMIRAAIRHRLRDPAMRKQFDSIDICQSVMASFFPRVANDRFEIASPAQLAGLFIQMARNKLAHQIRKHHQKCRDVAAAVSANDTHFGELQGKELTPDRIAQGREELADVLERLGEEERRIALMRGEGYEWGEIANQLGGTADGRRKQLQRAIAQAIALPNED